MLQALAFECVPAGVPGVVGEFNLTIASCFLIALPQCD